MIIWTILNSCEDKHEALELFFETASAEKIEERFHDEVYVTQVEVVVG